MENRYLISGKQLGTIKSLILLTLTILESKEPIINRKKAIENLERMDNNLTNYMQTQWVGLRKNTIDKDVKALKLAYKSLES